MKNLIYYESPIGRIAIAEEGDKVTDIFFGRPHSLQTDLIERETERNSEARDQLVEYFRGERLTFDFPLSMKGTPFQVSVWEALQEIPYGEIRSYRDIAEAIGNPNAYRAVGLANNKNPLAIVIPCHRVVGASGDLIGYGGGLNKKQFLLNLEQQHQKNGVR